MVGAYRVRGRLPNWSYSSTFDGLGAGSVGFHQVMKVAGVVATSSECHSTTVEIESASLNKSCKSKGRQGLHFSTCV